MKRLLKVIAWIIGILVLLVAAAAVLVPLLVDPNDYRDEIRNVVREKTGRELTIGGDIGVSVFPWLGAEINQVTLSNAPGFDEVPFARVAEAQVRVELLPLFSRELRVDTVVLDGLELNLMRRADGATNWQDLVPPEGAAAPEQAPEGGPGDGAPALAALAVGGLRVSDADISWTDQMTGQSVRVQDLELESGELTPGEAFPLELSYRFSVAEPMLEGRSELAARITVDPAQQVYRVEGLEALVQASGTTLPDGQLDARLAAATAHAELQQQTAAVEGLKLTLYGSEFSGRVQAVNLNDAPGVTGNLALLLESPQKLLQLAAPELAAQVDEDALAGSRIETVLQLSMAEQTAELSPIRGTFPGAELSAAVRAERLQGEPAGSGRLELTVGDGEKLLGPLAGVLPPNLQPAAFSGSRAKTEFSFDLAEGSAHIPQLLLAALGVELTAEAAGSGLPASPLFAGKLRSNEFVPRDVAAALGVELPESADPGVLTKAQLGTGFKAGPDQVALDGLEAVLDQTRLTGTLSARRFAAPVIRFDLRADRFDADRYLPPPVEGEPPQAGTPAAAAAGAAQLPLEQLRALDINGTARIGQLKAANLTTRDLHATLVADEGRFRVHPLGAQLYGGSYAGDLRLDVTGEVPQIAADERLKGIQAGPLLTDLLGEAPLTGTAELEAKVSAAGVEPDAIKRTLDGSAGFRFRDGTVKGINIGLMIRQAYAKVKGLPPPAEEPRETDFAELGGSLTIDDGVIQNRDLSAKSPLLRVQGEGTVNLVDETLDYRVSAAVVATVEGQGGEGLGELKGLTIPIGIEGPWTDPKIKLRLEDLVKARAGQALEKERGKLERRLEEKLFGKPKEETPAAPAPEGAAPTDTPPPAEEKSSEGELKDKLKEDLGGALKGLFGR